jgi:hypothetical protein
MILDDLNRNKIPKNIHSTASIWSAVAERSGDTAFYARDLCDINTHFELQILLMRYHLQTTDPDLQLTF